MPKSAVLYALLCCGMPSMRVVLYMLLPTASNTGSQTNNAAVLVHASSQHTAAESLCRLSVNSVVLCCIFSQAKAKASAGSSASAGASSSVSSGASSNGNAGVSAGANANANANGNTGASAEAQAKAKAEAEVRFAAASNVGRCQLEDTVWRSANSCACFDSFSCYKWHRLQLCHCCLAHVCSVHGGPLAVKSGKASAASSCHSLLTTTSGSTCSAI